MSAIPHGQEHRGPLVTTWAGYSFPRIQSLVGEKTLIPLDGVGRGVALSVKDRRQAL